MLRKNWYYILFAFAALLTIYMDAYIARNILDGDASGHLHRAFVMARENNLFTTKDLYGSNEINLFGASFYFAPFFKLFTNWTLVRLCGTVLMQAIYVLSFLYLTKQLEVGKPARWAAAALLLSPFSTTYARIVLYHLYYLPLITYSFFLLGLMTRLIKTPREKPREAVLPAVLFAALWVAVGMNGIRHMMILLAPLLIQFAVLLLLRLRRTSELRGWLAENSVKEPNTMLRLLAMLLYALVFYVIGYAINANVLMQYYDCVDYSTGIAFMPFINAEKVGWIFSEILVCIGFRTSTLPVTSVRSVAMVFSLLSFGYIGWCSYHHGYRLDKEPSLSRQCLYGLYLSTLALTVLIFIFNTSISAYELYFIPAVVMAFPILAMEMDRVKDKCLSCARKLLIYATCVAFVFQGGYTMVWLHHKNTSLLDIWSGLYSHEVMITDCDQDCVEFMHIFGYQYGMMPYWFANSAVEMCDGDLAIAPYAIDPETGEIELMNVLTRPSFRREELPDTLIVFVEPENLDVFAQAYPSAVAVHNGAYFTGLEVATDLIIAQ